MQRIAVQTRKKREVIDITGVVQESLVGYDGRTGTCHLSILHTTAALTTADLDPGTDLDMLDAFEALTPSCTTATHTIQLMCLTTSSQP